MGECASCYTCTHCGCLGVWAGGGEGWAEGAVVQPRPLFCRAFVSLAVRQLQKLCGCRPTYGRYGIRGLVIDPYNELAQNTKMDRETVYINDMLRQVRAGAVVLTTKVFSLSQKMMPSLRLDRETTAGSSFKERGRCLGA